MDFVFIYGPPAVGKLTVSKELARLTSYALLDNHVTIDCVRPLFDFGTKPFVKLLRSIRLQVLRSAARNDRDLIFTFVYDHPADRRYVESLFRAIETPGGRVCPVRLTCGLTTLEQRVTADDRVRRPKLASVEALRAYLGEHSCFSALERRPSLTIDTTEQEPAAAARQIVRHFGLSITQVN